MTLIKNSGAHRPHAMPKMMTWAELQAYVREHTKTLLGTARYIEEIRQEITATGRIAENLRYRVADAYAPAGTYDIKVYEDKPQSVGRLPLLLNPLDGTIKHIGAWEQPN